MRATYFYSGMADVAAETGDRDYQSAVMSLWDNMVNKKYYVTGGIGSGFSSILPGGGVVLTNAQVFGNKGAIGGGIVSVGARVTLTNSSVGGNSGLAGGGIAWLPDFSAGAPVTADPSIDVSLTNSSASDNYASIAGGGFFI